MELLILQCYSRSLRAVFGGRDVNAAQNIKVAGGLSETINGRGGSRKTVVQTAASYEASTHQAGFQLSLFP
jgi:putative transposase